MTPRFFVPGTHERGERIRIEGGDAHHIGDVLRLGAGDRVEIVDSAANAFAGELERTEDGIVVRLVEQLAGLEVSALRVEVAQAVPKGAKMDFIVEKATELGAAAVHPFTSERTIARRPGAEKVARWNRIARAAAEQSGRRDVPAVSDVVEFAALLDCFASYDAVLFAWESARDAPLRDAIPALVRDSASVLVVIGPEGGFSHAEAGAARARGARVVSLGRRILRTETAALAILAVLAYLVEDERSEARPRRIKED